MTKIRVRVGEVEVEYEGPEGFLEKKLPDLIVQLSKLSSHTRGKGTGGGKGSGGGEEPGTLAGFLGKHNAAKNQERRFLATAEWLHLKGSDTLRTGDVSKALQDNRQVKLTNPSDCLNKNIKKGRCEKKGDGFFVTEEGRTALG